MKRRQPIHDDKTRCYCCNKILRGKVVWLELSNTDNEFYPVDELPEGHVSQGCFEFGSTCAKKVVVA